jgi:hypothetical protein
VGPGEYANQKSKNVQMTELASEYQPGTTLYGPTENPEDPNGVPTALAKNAMVPLLPD